MIVKDLIEELKTFVQSLRVVTPGFDECDLEDVEVVQLVSVILSLPLTLNLDTPLTFKAFSFLPLFMYIISQRFYNSACKIVHFNQRDKSNENITTSWPWCGPKCQEGGKG